MFYLFKSLGVLAPSDKYCIWSLYGYSFFHRTNIYIHLIQCLSDLSLYWISYKHNKVIIFCKSFILNGSQNFDIASFLFPVYKNLCTIQGTNGKCCRNFVESFKLKWFTKYNYVIVFVMGSRTTDHQSKK